MSRSLSISTHRSRRGAALLLATLSAAIVATAAIAILHAGKRQTQATNALEETIRGEHVAHGMTELALATLRQNPGFLGVVQDKYLNNRDTYAVIGQNPPGTYIINVFLYAGTPVPAAKLEFDAAVLKR